MDSNRHESVASLTNYFAESTSMHGVSRFVGKRGFFRRAFWVLAVLAGAGVAVYNIWTIVIVYSRWEVSTVVSLKYNSRLRFPAITFCNLNPVMKSSIEVIQTVFDSLKTTSQFQNAIAPTQGSQLFGSVSSAVSNGDVRLFESGSSSVSNEEFNSGFLKRINFQRVLASLNTSVKIQIGHQISDMLLECSFQGLVCSHRNFTHFYNYMHGNCYTFNPTDDDSTYISRTGPLYGLSLTLYADEGEYISNLSSSVGFKVVVHSPNTMPFPEDDGFDISPGFATSVGVTKVAVERVSHPYGNCKLYAEGAEEPPNIFTTEVPNISYSDKTCKRTCLQKMLVSECGCCYNIYPCNSDALNIINSSIPHPVGFCNIETNKNETCASAALKRHKNNQLICPDTCDPPCQDESHQLEISTAMWPASNYLSSLLDDFINGLRNKQSVSPINENASADDKDTFFRRNMLKLNVFYKELNYQKIRTRPSYDWKSLLSDVGGQAGLWLGFSLLTLGEVLELIADVVIHICTKPFRSKKVEVSSK
ncbi:amiloride-sensitive sodium channel subunit gamma-like [Haliotis rubra]|uniref:amiloride-sensitive sodium channel subunit gamma-like n=1 Tax=Haliotis rubra TaxID=36100 RepID=UPI001EE63216|nr:amiloride-sensitive sodium channel subunit gamma-like [Haliotis rubra]